jgi:hypothetical protein
MLTIKQNAATKAPAIDLLAFANVEKALKASHANVNPV